MPDLTLIMDTNVQAGAPPAVSPDRMAFPGPMEAEALRRPAVRGGAIVVSSRLVIQSFAWVVTILVARVLRPYDYGILTAGGIFLSLGDILAEAGIAKALVQKPQLDTEDLAQAFTLNLVLSLAIYALLFIVAGPAAAFLQSLDLVAFLRVVGLVLLLIPFRSVPMAILDRRLQMGRQSAIYVLSSVIQSVVVLGLAFAGFGYWARAGGAIIAKVTDVAFLVWQTAWVPRLCWPGKWSNPIVQFGLHFSGSRLCWFVYRNADYAILGRLLGPIALGYYSLAFMLISLPVEKITASCNQIAFPVFCRMSHDRERIRSWFLRLSLLLGFLGTPALVGLALVAEDAIRVVLGAKWAPAILPLQIMSLAGVFMVIGGAIDGLFNSLGRPDINFRFTIVSVLIYPILFYVMGRTYGVTGVALVWALLYPVMVTILITRTGSITGISIRDILKTQAPVWAAVLIMCLAVLVTQWFLRGSQPSSLRLAISVFSGVLGYGMGIWLFAWRSVAGSLNLLWGELRTSK